MGNAQPTQPCRPPATTANDLRIAQQRAAKPIVYKRKFNQVPPASFSVTFFLVNLVSCGAQLCRNTGESSLELNSREKFVIIKALRACQNQATTQNESRGPAITGCTLTVRFRNVSRTTQQGQSRSTSLVKAGHLSKSVCNRMTKSGTKLSECSDQSGLGACLPAASEYSHSSDHTTGLNYEMTSKAQGPQRQQLSLQNWQKMFNVDVQLSWPKVTETMQKATGSTA